jgi:hypothetical protein
MGLYLRWFQIPKAPRRGSVKMTVLRAMLLLLIKPTTVGSLAPSTGFVMSIRFTSSKTNCEYKYLSRHEVSNNDAFFERFVLVFVGLELFLCLGYNALLIQGKPMTTPS